MAHSFNVQPTFSNDQKSEVFHVGVWCWGQGMDFVQVYDLSIGVRKELCSSRGSSLGNLHGQREPKFVRMGEAHNSKTATRADDAANNIIINDNKSAVLLKSL